MATPPSLPAVQTDGSHWSRDYVEHIRSVHFAIVVVSAALIILSFSGSSAGLSKARQQIQAINELTARWDEKWAQQNAESFMKPRIGQYPRRQLNPFIYPLGFMHLPLQFMSLVYPVGDQLKTVTFVYRGSKEKQRVALKFMTPNWIVMGQIRELPRGDRSDKSSRFGLAHPGNGDYSKWRSVSVMKPKTLEEFKQFWDATYPKHYIQVPETLDPNVLVILEVPVLLGTVSSDTSIKILPDDQSIPIRETWDLWLVAYSDLAKKMHFADPGHKCAYMHVTEKKQKNGTRNVDTAFIPVMDWREDPEIYPDPIELNLQKVFVDKFGEVLLERKTSIGTILKQRFNVIPGKFETSFRELNSLTKTYQSLELDKIEPVLHAEEQRTGESFEAFGIKFPAQGTTLWGIAVILVTQLYFFIHLRHLNTKMNRDDPGWEVAWIGVYPSVEAKVLFLSSAFIMPACAVVILGIRGLVIGDLRPFYWLLLVAGGCMSTALAFGSWRRIPRFN